MFLTTGEAERKYKQQYQITKHIVKQWAENKIIEGFQTAKGHWRINEVSLKKVLGIKEDA